MNRIPLDLEWVAPALAAVLVLVGYGGVWLFRLARYMEARRALDMANTETVRVQWNKKERRLAVMLLLRRPWPLGKWTRIQGFNAKLEQLLFPVPVKHIQAYLNRRKAEERREASGGLGYEATVGGNIHKAKN